MNEQVTNILNQNITKTAKIQQLLLLGLTRRQVRFRAKRLQKNA